MTLTEEIMALKKEKNAVILAHYYVRPEVQAIADYVGDSFYLSKVAIELKEQTIVFCGVSFMGESAKILNPGKTVLMPDVTSDCAMAHMANAETVRKMREKYDDLAVVCYINSTAYLKTLADVCVTSSNAVQIVKNLPNRHIFFIPDKNLGRYVASQVPEKEFIFNDGFCPIHEKMILEEVLALKAEHPEAPVLAHPECCDGIREIADYLGSTSGIIKYTDTHDDKEFIICTENGVKFKMEQNHPEKHYYFTKTEPVCRDMKKITLEKIRDVLKTGANQVEVEDNLRVASQKPLERMLELAK